MCQQEGYKQAYSHDSEMISVGAIKGHMLSCLLPRKAIFCGLYVNSTAEKPHCWLVLKSYRKSWVLMEPKPLSYSGLVCLDRSHDCHKVVINHSDCCLAKQLLVEKLLNISRKELNMERVCVSV